MELEGRVWLKEDNKNFLGSGRVYLLEMIEKTGSITKAAKEMKMSYKAAWDAVDAMNNLSNESLVIRNTGGKGGGGTKLTEKAKEIIKVFKALEEKYGFFLKSIEKDCDNFNDLYKNIRRINLKTSARNQLFGTVTKIKKGAVNGEVELDISDQNKIVAIITNNSIDSLGFSIGEEAYAIIKASWIIVSKEKPQKLSARNIIKTKITAITKGAVNSEIKMGMSGKTLVAIITNESLENLKFKVNDTAYAIFKASNVILGA